jgi:chemotaxis regulatin CheY-phosphate phosphatase CheZ
MTNVDSLNDVLVKIENMRETLRFSNDMLPLLGDLFIFIKDMIPLMLEANVSVRDSATRLPTASENLDQVSKTTEVATHEVMDKLDVIMSELGEVSQGVKEETHKDTLLKKIEDVQNTASEIIFALQFQDITTQQLDHAKRILMAVNEKFGNLFTSFGRVKSNTSLGQEVIQAFEKEYNRMKGKELEEFEQKTADTIRRSSFSQDDIDSLFKQ